MIELKYMLAKDLQGGGGNHVEQTWATGPINLLRAADMLPAVEIRLRNAYGNVGFAGAWVEVDGVAIDDFELQQLDRAEVEADAKYWREVDRGIGQKPAGRLERARDCISRARGEQ